MREPTASASRVTVWFPAKERHATASPLATSSAAHCGNARPGRGVSCAAGDGKGVMKEPPAPLLSPQGLSLIISDKRCVAGRAAELLLSLKISDNRRVVGQLPLASGCKLAAG